MHVTIHSEKLAGERWLVLHGAWEETWYKREAGKEGSRCK